MVIAALSCTHTRTHTQYTITHSVHTPSLNTHTLNTHNHTLNKQSLTQDGIEKVHEEVLAAATVQGYYSPSVLQDTVIGQPTSVHLFEYTARYDAVIFCMGHVYACVSSCVVYIHAFALYPHTPSPSPSTPTPHPTPT